ncbi:MAG: PPC domain-containing DNA-binding protein [Thermosphaera sp.]
MRVQAFKISEGETIPGAILERLKQFNLRNGFLTGIGGLEYAEIGVYNPESKTYGVFKQKAATNEILEVGSLQGNYLLKPDGELSLHLHVVVGSGKGVFTGHLLTGVVKPMMEVFAVEVDTDLSKIFTHRWLK